MNKLLNYLNLIEDLARSLAASNGLSDDLRAKAQKVVDASVAIKKEISHPDFNRIWSYLSHGGNLPGTPQSRGEVPA